MKFSCLLAAAIAIVGGMASAATVSYNIGSQSIYGTATANLVAGQSFSVTADPADTWSLGAYPRDFNANGTEVNGAFYGSFGAGVHTYNYGAMIGYFSPGNFFLVGTNYSGVAPITGTLSLFTWDSYYGDNSGSITANITTVTPSAVPLPASGLMLLGSLSGILGLRRRKKS